MWAYDYTSRPKSRQAAYHFTVTRSGVLTSKPAQPWDPAPPFRMGPQRCLSSRETIERLAFVLPKEPALTPKDAGALLSAWWSKYPAAREYFPEHPKATRHVWMGGDYIDDGTYKATPEDAAERWREVREALVSIEREDGAVAYMNPAYPTHTRDSGPRG